MAISKSLKALVVSIDELVSDPNNVRTHSERNIRAVMSSLEQIGQQKPVVCLPDNTVIAGNATLESAKRLGWTEIAVSYFEGDEKQSKAYAISDNRSAELADWHWADLTEQLKDLDADYDLDSLGWGDEDLGPLFKNDFDPSGWEDEGDDFADDQGGSESGHGKKSVNLTDEQYEVVSQAIQKVRDISGDQTISEGRCLELISADYISG